MPTVAIHAGPIKKLQYYVYLQRKIEGGGIEEDHNLIYIKGILSGTEETPINTK